MRIGQRVFDLLEKQSKKQVDLAKYLNLTTSTVNGWRKENRNPSSELIIPICEFFDISPYYLLTGKEKNSSYELTNDELNLLNMYNSLSDKRKGKAELFIEQLTQEQANEQVNDITEEQAKIKEVG